MTRLLAGLIVFALASPALGGPAEDKNWGDKQTKEGKKSDKLEQPKSKLHEKEGKFGMEKEKIEARSAREKK
jgi:hypothetical protein